MQAAVQPLLVLAPQASVLGLGRLLAELGAGLRIAELEACDAAQVVNEYLDKYLHRVDKVARLSESSQIANEDYGRRHLIGGAINDSGTGRE